MHLNSVPRAYADIIHLAVKAHAGATTHGVLVGLEQNDSAAIAADLFDLTGDPATPLVPGKQAVLNTRKQAAKTARSAASAAIAAGREYCRLGISLLKPVLGSTYNGAWEAAGFLTPSLAMPDEPVAMLIAFRHYFEAHPTQENAPGGITAVLAQTRMTAIQSAQFALAAAEAAQLGAKAARDFAQRKLRKRMSGLRSELVQLLSREDGIWREFGFRRPADGRLPDDVEGLQLTAGGPGMVVVQWDASTKADDYRVMWRPDGAPIESATEVGLFTDLQALISELPAGSAVVVGVSARNDSGETEPTEATIVVPSESTGSGSGSDPGSGT